MSKRRQFTAEFKARIVLEELTGVKDRAEICREHILALEVELRIAWKVSSFRGPTQRAQSGGRKICKCAQCSPALKTTYVAC